MSINTSRIRIANIVLKSFARDTEIGVKNGYLTVKFLRFRNPIERRWMTKGGSFYPPWHRLWARGGTAMTALAQLIRWIQDKPIVGLATWRHWASESIGLLSYGPTDSLTALLYLQNAGWPERPKCVLCGIELTKGHDWWNLDGVSGPCCHYGIDAGCNQKGGAK